MRFLTTSCQSTFLLILLLTTVAIAYHGESSAAQITITWTDNSNNEDRFEIERKLGLTGTYARIATVGPNITSYADSGLADETTYYCYRVRASNGYGDSAYSNEDCGTATLAQTLTVTKAGSGSGMVGSNPAGINCGTDCTEGYGNGTIVTLSATPATGSVFAGWSNAGCSGTGTCTVTMDADTTVTATFNLQIFSLTVTKAGSGDGTVTSASTGINCGTDCTEDYGSGSVVTLTATPATGSVFAGWSNAGCSGTGTCTVTMDADTTVTATFNLQIFSLTVTKAGSGDGTVTSAPTGINCGADCTEEYGSGKIVTLTATRGVGSTFAGLSGGGCNGASTCMLTINGAISVTSTFSKTFTDDPLTSKTTMVKASHFLEALEAINTLRQRKGLGTISFSAPIPAVGVTISTKDMTTLQTGLNAVYDVSGRTRPTFDAIVTRTTVIGKRQMDQIRNGIRVLE